jgi:hypothetical protein
VPVEKARPTLEGFVAVFPTSARYWKYYIEQEISARNFEAAEKLFARCLLNVPDIDLWVTYLVGSASALVTFIRVLCTLRTQTSQTINMQLRFYSATSSLQNTAPTTNCRRRRRRLSSSSKTWAPICVGSITHLVSVNSISSTSTSTSTTYLPPL